MDTLTVKTVDTKKVVEITPAVITPAKRIIPAEAFVKSLVARQKVLQAQLEEVEAQLAEVEDKGVDVVAIKATIIK